MVEQPVSAGGYSHKQRGPLCLILYGARGRGVGRRGGDRPNGRNPGRRGAASDGGSGAAFHYLRVEDEGDALAIGLRSAAAVPQDRALRGSPVGRSRPHHAARRLGHSREPPRRLGLGPLGRDCVVLQTTRGRLCIGTDDAANLASYLQAEVRLSRPKSRASLTNPRRRAPARGIGVPGRARPGAFTGRAASSSAPTPGRPVPC